MSGELQIIERSPSNEVAFGKKAAQALMDVVREQGLAKKFGGQKEHIYVEAWQLLGQFAGLSAETEVQSCEVDGIKGAIATATLRDKDGNEAGGAEAYCMRDEPNWKNKPWFQLASMAQTRAVSKAFRNRLSWIAVLAGYSGTPAEEMEGIQGESKKDSPSASHKPTEGNGVKVITEGQRKLVYAKSKTAGIEDVEVWLHENYGINKLSEIPFAKLNDILEGIATYS